MKSGHPAISRPVTKIAKIAVIAMLAVLAVFTVSPTQAQASPTSSQDSTQLMAGQADKQVQLTASNSKALTRVSVNVMPCIQGKGWTNTWVSASKTAGTASKGLRAVRIKLTGLGAGVTGNIYYRAYDKGKGWGKTMYNGRSTGNVTTPIQAIKIWLGGDVSKHYDVLYRSYVKGKGWQPWVKNMTATGTSRKGYYITAMQVKLSAKTAQAFGNSNKVGITYETRLLNAGWQSWRQNGQIAGKAGSKKIDGFVLRVNTASIGGGVQYRAYIQGKRWSQGWRTTGRIVGTTGKRLEALQIKLTGNIAKKYDIYYRAYVNGHGWLGWAKNGGVSGSTGMNMSLGALQVVIVAKGVFGPSAGDGATVNQNLKTLNGIDISSWQSDISIKDVPGDFVIVKATGGKGYTNPYYEAQAYATVKSGKLLGLYHFARERGCSGSAIQEADYFVGKVKPYIGRAVLVLDWEADALVLGPKWAKDFLDRVYARTGVKPLIYMSKSKTREYNWSSVARSYKLWVAQYPNYNTTGYKSDPWRDDDNYGAWEGPTIFQYTSTGRLSGYGGNLDLNLFYGTTAYWKKLASKS